MLRIRDLQIPVRHSADDLKKAAAAALRVSPSDIQSLKIAKRSIDARKKNAIVYIYTLDVEVSKKEATVLKKADAKKVSVAINKPYQIPAVEVEAKHRPIVVGFGPAGMFCALILAQAGLRPIVLERGADAATRREKVLLMQKEGILDPACNVQFGEGGAGTFSDGKLTTGTKNERIPYVLESFVRFGADESILYDAKPHIGTDILVDVVQNLRREVIRLGGEVYFNTCFNGFEEKEDGTVLVKAGGLEPLTFETDALVLATGHSARDTFELLYEHDTKMEQKTFSMGVRIEHKQDWLNTLQFAGFKADLPPADYKVNCNTKDGIGVYTFCMCPGGHVMAAASEEGGVVTNGMSNFAREGENCNAAVLVTLNPSVFPDDHVLSGMYWQRQIEQTAFRAGGENYHAPAQLVVDFLKKKKSTALGKVQPTYKPGVTLCDLHDVLPDVICNALAEAIPMLDRKLPGFAANDAVMTAPETRSSSPVRIVRDSKTKQSETFPWLYPCGEGAGYAGGIMSAAVDGITTAEAIIAKLYER